MDVKKIASIASKALVLAVFFDTFLMSISRGGELPTLNADKSNVELLKDAEVLLRAMRYDFPYSDHNLFKDGLLTPGSYAPCENGVQPVVVWNNDATESNPKLIRGAQSEKLQARLGGKFVLFDCSKAEIPGAVAGWQTNFANSKSAKSGISPDLKTTKDILLFDSVISGIAHQEAFELDLVFDIDKSGKTAKVDATAVRSFSPTGYAYIGKQNAESSWVYDKPFPKTVAIER